MSLIASRLAESLFLALSAIILLPVAHGGTSWPPVMLALALYLVALTLWVRGQYMDFATSDLARQKPAFSYAFIAGLVLACLGLILLLVWWLTGSDESGFVLAGAITLLAGVGYLIIAGRLHLRMRGTVLSRRRSVSWISVALLVLGGLVFVGVMSLVWHDARLTTPRKAGLAASALMLVLGGAWASELVLNWATKILVNPVGTSTRKVLTRSIIVCLVSGLAAFGLLVLGYHWSSSSTILGIALIVLGLLVISLVSATQAAGGLIVAVVALMGVTPGQATESPTFAPKAGSTPLVALGDSYMSGEGASVYYRGTDEAGGNQCRRSPTSWAALAGQQEPFNGLVFLACQGATTKNVRYAHQDIPPVPTKQDPEPGTQLTQYRIHFPRLKPGLVVLSIGGNDAGFSTIGKMCLGPGDCDETESSWIGAFDQVRRNLIVAYAEVRDVFPDSPVAVTGYPDPIDREESARACTQVSLSSPERGFIHRFVLGLNSVIASTAAEFGFYYIEGTQDALANEHLQLCDKLNQGRPGLNFIGFRSMSGVAQQRFDPANWIHSSLHPNELGHAALLRSFEAWLHEERISQRVWPLAAQDPASIVQYHSEADLAGILAAAPVPTGCDLFSDSPSTGCRPQGDAWALSHLARAVLYPGVFALAFVLLVWLFAVSGFALLRKVQSIGTG